MRYDLKSQFYGVLSITGVIRTFYVPLPCVARRPGDPRDVTQSLQTRITSGVVLTHWWCPVCDYRLSFAPEDYRICPCCGTEFGNDDRYATHEELRVEWIARGTPWFSSATPKPAAWSYMKQQLDHMLSGVVAGTQRQKSCPMDTTGNGWSVSPNWFAHVGHQPDQSVKGVYGSRD